MRRLGFVVLGVLAVGCATTAPPPGAPPSRAPGAEPLEFAVYEVDTPAFLERYLSVRVCQGWAIQDILHTGDKFVVVMYRGGTAADRDNCGEI